MIRPYPVERFQSAAELNFPPDAILMHRTYEDRSVIPDAWRDQLSPGSSVELEEADTSMGFRNATAGTREYNPKRQGDLAELLSPFKGRPVYLDYTGLSHHVWMPVVKHGLNAGINLRCIYSEPLAYKDIPDPAVGDFFDLSERIQGIAPVPSFTFLADPAGRPPLLVALLGFEGTRFKHVIETLEPEGLDIVPVIGVPGFRYDFPFHTYRGNADALRTQQAWDRIVFADAACPFSLFDRLGELRRDHPGKFLQISLIGTKPHALGATLFATIHHDVELVYDHPVRRRDRTTGAGRCHVYDIAKFHADLAPT